MRFAHSLLALAAFAVPVQAQNPKSQLKYEIDALLRELAKDRPTSGLDAAKFLIAAMRGPRQHDLSDGPFMRGPKDTLLQARRNNGLFGSGSAEEIRITTAWAHQALSELDAKRFSQELQVAKKAFAKAYGLDGNKLVAALTPHEARRFAGKSKSEKTVDRALARVAEYEMLIEKQGREAKMRAWDPFQQKGLDWITGKMKEGRIYVPSGPKGEMVADAGISALCLAALASKPEKLRTGAENKHLDQGVRFLLESQQADGSFSTYLPNYVTCTAILALSRTGRADVAKAMERAQVYLLGIQNAERQGFVREDRDYGSIGYGNDRRGDLSNTQMALDALRQTGLPAEHEALEKALVFLRRTQNLPGKDGWRGTRRTKDGRKVTVEAGSDGGASYYPGSSMAGYDDTAEGTQIPRSYGSMTYALLKCYVLAGLPKEDPRLQAALNWCTSHFTVDYNPGAKVKKGKEKILYQGLYYYYLTMSRALALAEVDEVKGKDWRSVLRKKLVAEQNADGSWINKKNGRWWEDNPFIATAYSLLALSE